AAVPGNPAGALIHLDDEGIEDHRCPWDSKHLIGLARRRADHCRRLLAALKHWQPGIDQLSVSACLDLVRAEVDIEARPEVLEGLRSTTTRRCRRELCARWDGHHRRRTTRAACLRMYGIGIERCCSC